MLGLGLDPVADHLLLGAHVVDQPLDRFGEIGHGGGRRPARSALGDGLAQSLDRRSEISRRRARDRHRARRLALDAEIMHRGGEPILEFGIEAVLRLARLQVEEAEHERACKPEQR